MIKAWRVYQSALIARVIFWTSTGVPDITFAAYHRATFLRRIDGIESTGTGWRGANVYQQVDIGERG